MEYSIVNLIEAMLAPGIMISACGLLLLGMNNKYSLVVSRLRALDEEKRKMLKSQQDQPLSREDETRWKSISDQIVQFDYRIYLVRNAVLSYSIAVGFFILSCLAIGLQLAVTINVELLAILFFLAGMVSVLVGIQFAAREVVKGFQIVQIELKSTN